MAENIVYSKPISIFSTQAEGRGQKVKTTYKLKVTDTGRKETTDKTGDPKASRPILTYEVLRYDTQSDNRRFQEFARRLIKKDKVDVVFGAFSSASRESIRGIMEKGKMLYFYNNQYEGGVCSKTTFVTGAVPEQQFSTLVPWMMDKYGKNVYTIAADYNFGQISAEWVRQIVKENGGTMVGEEFIPLDVSQFSQTIQKIQNWNQTKAQQATRRQRIPQSLWCLLRQALPLKSDGFKNSRQYYLSHNKRIIVILFLLKIF